MNTKETNPKEAVGTKKPPISTISVPVLAELGVAMMEGSRKYGRHNYRVSGVRASTYYDAMFRHMGSWWEGEDIDPDSGLSHVTKAIATLFVLRDAMIQNMFNDDRPPKATPGWIGRLKKSCEAIIEKYPDSKEAFTEIGQKIGQVPDHEIVLEEKPLGKCPKCDNVMITVPGQSGGCGLCDECCKCI
jgi:hypothetical protein